MNRLERLKEHIGNFQSKQSNLFDLENAVTTLIYMHIEELENQKFVALKTNDGEYVLCKITELTPIENESVKTIQLPEINIEFDEEKESYNHKNNDSWKQVDKNYEKQVESLMEENQLLDRSFTKLRHQYGMLEVKFKKYKNLENEIKKLGIDW